MLAAGDPMGRCLGGEAVRRTFCLRMKAAISSSSRVQPVIPSTTSSATCASASAVSACCRICGMKICEGSSSKTMPPVSTTLNSYADHHPGAYVRSRVTPGSSCTSAPVSKRCVIRLAIVDLPTLGRPSTTIVGFLDARPASALSEPAGVTSAAPTASASAIAADGRRVAIRGDERCPRKKSTTSRGRD
eukprot:scaffold14840_cov101-Isochrysis_galbana.AAC.4